MEIWDVLDENGKITGKTINKGDKIAWQEGIYHPGTDVWIINSENKLLIQKRSLEKEFAPNVWAMTGGSVIKGESALETLKREAMEELGIELDIESAVKIKHYRTGNVWLDEYIVRQDIDLDKVVLQKEEVCDVKFATYDEIEELFKNNLFIGNRWEYVRDEIKKYLLTNNVEINKKPAYSFCGANCSDCDYGKNNNCKGCKETRGCPFGKQCFIAKYILTGGKENYELFKKQLIDEINKLNIVGMPQIDELNPLNGVFVNLDYPLPNGKSMKFLDDDDIYLGNQVESEFNDGEIIRCFGIVANMDFILISEYGINGDSPELIIYKKR